MHNALFYSSEARPVCSGTGLVALDVVFGAEVESGPRMWAGGSCGNVLTILAYLGWNAYPVARLRDDVFARRLIEDLAQWQVDTSLIYQESTGSTPIIVERIVVATGQIPRHRFEFMCPNCRSWLPRFRAVRAKDVGWISEEMPQSSVFYLDRATAGTLELARRNREQGALVVFEPSSIDDRRLFAECLQVSDILKYSSDRLGRDEDLARGVDVALQVETLGSTGLRYRRKKDGLGTDAWRRMEPFVVSGLKDAAGSGDWCTAGLIHYLGVTGQSQLREAPEDDIEDALRFGQALAAINCLYEGARGSMYSLSKTAFADLVHNMLSEDCSEFGDHRTEEPGLSMDSTECICPSCPADG